LLLIRGKPPDNLGMKGIGLQRIQTQGERDNPTMKISRLIWVSMKEFRGGRIYGRSRTKKEFKYEGAVWRKVALIALNITGGQGGDTT